MPLPEGGEPLGEAVAELGRGVAHLTQGAGHLRRGAAGLGQALGATGERSAALRLAAYAPSPIPGGIEAGPASLPSPPPPAERTFDYRDRLLRARRGEAQIRVLDEIRAATVSGALASGDAMSVLASFVASPGVDDATAEAFFRVAEALDASDHESILIIALVWPPAGPALDRLLVSAARLDAGSATARVLARAAQAGLPPALRARYFGVAQRLVGADRTLALDALRTARRGSP